MLYVGVHFILQVDMEGMSVEQRCKEQVVKQTRPKAHSAREELAQKFK